MKAIQQARFGSAEVLELVEVPPPSPLPTEVVVHVRAIGINPVDAYVRAGRVALFGPPPFILGWDISGIIEHVMPGVTRFAVGDEVFGMPLFPRAANAYAELVAAPSRQLARKPRGLDHVHAAALPLAGLTAWQSLVDTAQVGPGHRVLVHGAGGGVGHLAVQIAKQHGAYVIATASAAKHGFVRELGADQVIDYRTEDFAARVRDVDIVLDVIGNGYAERSIPTLRPDGLLITLVQRADEQLARAVREAGRRFAGVTVEPDHVALEKLAAWVDDGKLRVHVEETFPLEQMSRAHTRLDRGGVTGKLVSTIAP